MDKEESVFQFDLRESVYFEDHQQVSEITSISLEPEISIQTYGDYISIRGVIALNGQYRSVDNSVVEQLQPSFEKHALRYIDSVEENENGFASFSHQFPVEISVPLYRIADLNDVAVDIDSFDYDLPDPAQLIVEAGIAIHGISDSESRSKETLFEDTAQDMDEWDSFNVVLQQEKESSESLGEVTRANVDAGLSTQAKEESDSDDESPTSVDESSLESDSSQREESSVPKDLTEEREKSSIQKNSTEEREESSVQKDLTEEQEESSDERLEQSTHVEEEEPTNSTPEDTGNLKEAEQSSSKESSEGRWKWKSQSFDDFFGKHKEESSVHESSSVHMDSPDYETDETSVVFDEYVESSSVYPDRLPHVENQEEQISEEEETEQEVSSAQADISYLSDIFQSREENDEEQFAKMKLCIVQDKDTLETIAERYQITSMHLIKRNSLESENITPGQLLYIPIRKKDH